MQSSALAPSNRPKGDSQPEAARRVSVAKQRSPRPSQASQPFRQTPEGLTQRRQGSQKPRIFAPSREFCSAWRFHQPGPTHPRKRPGVRRPSAAFERPPAHAKLRRAGALQNAAAPVRTPFQHPRPNFRAVFLANAKSHIKRQKLSRWPISPNSSSFLSTYSLITLFPSGPIMRHEDGS